MKTITLEKVYQALQTLEPEITLDEDLRKRAAVALQRMHELAE